MEIISGYVKTIAFFMIFTAFIEIITPSGSFKKYIRLITSLILIALLLEPIGVILNVLSSDSFNYDLQDMAAYNPNPKEREKYEQAQAEMVVNEYKNSLTGQVKQVIKTQLGITVKDTAIIVNEDYESEDFAEILGIHITALLQTGSEESTAVKRALLGNADSGADAEKSKNVTELNIKKCLSDFYNVPESNIHITVQE